ncbi:WD40-repeat-containing domain protein [Polychytrium aggregatum]|uniref:WD40-repeat-containing domain protein n=1 Tax=Polychytrium aggregatum TaxID=110093 RepID=UPI0022FEB26B|nr:WD40-repeat-containing domain protein [Polychytrium aggregatum]KAI9206352.1 WD40-repeat-containing domain protein [Polychytrium aggregatum]
MLHNVLNVGWTFGLNHSIPGGVVNLSDRFDKLLFYTSSHCGILHNWGTQQQQILQGHSNQISCSRVSPNKRWIVTADTGSNAMMIVWDLYPDTGAEDTDPAMAPSTGKPLPPSSSRNMSSALPIKTIFDPHQNGVVDIAFTQDSRYIITLGNEPEKQTLAIWNWTTESNEPLLSFVIDGEPQRVLNINPEDPGEIITNGHHTVNFFTWSADSGIKQLKPVFSSKDFKHKPTGFTYSTFILTGGQSLSATLDGDVIIWSDRSLNNLSVKLDRGEKAAIKYMRLHSGPINFVTSVHGKYVVTGGEDGFLKIYDNQFRLMLWFEKLRAGPVTSVSFTSPTPSDTLPREAICEDMDIPELVVSTRSGKVLLLSKNVLASSSQKNDGKVELGIPNSSVILETQPKRVTALAAHPTKPLIAMSGHSGLVQVWNYLTKKVTISKQFEAPSADTKTQNYGHGKPKHEVLEPSKIEAVSFSKNGEIMGIGFNKGTIRIIRSDDLEDLNSSSRSEPAIPASAADESETLPPLPRAQLGFKVSASPIIMIQFSDCGLYMAAADGSHAVIVFKYESLVLPGGETGSRWSYIGKCRSHFKQVIGLIFLPSSETNKTRLLSFSKDRHVVEYDLDGASITAGLPLKSIKRIEQASRPLAVTLGPKPSQEGAEQFILTVDSDYKFKYYNSTTQLCRQTSLGPTYAGPVSSLLPLYQGDDGACKYMAFAAQEKIIGVIKFPLDGNPFRSMGVVGHPGEISNICCSYDGNFIFTSGGEDATVYMWSMDASVLESQVIMGGRNLEPFLNLLDPSGQGIGGAIYKEMEDYFYYAQLRSQGEDNTKDRVIDENVKISEVPSIMQAMGYYPSSLEIDDMLNEIRYSGLSGSGPIKNDITFEDLIKLYINHRPVADHTFAQIESALAVAHRLEPGEPAPSGPTPKLGPTEKMSKFALMALLQQYGEPMSMEDFEVAMNALLMNTDYDGQLPDLFTAPEFIGGILGLQPKDEVEANDDEEEVISEAFRNLLPTAVTS